MDTHSKPLDRAAYSVAEAAALIGIGRDGIYAALRNGQISGRKYGKRTIIPASSLQRFLANLPLLELPNAPQSS